MVFRSTTCGPRSPTPNTNQAKGSFDGPTRASTIDANDQLKSADEYPRLIIAYKNGGAGARCRTSADAVEAAENTRSGRLGEQHTSDHPQRPASTGTNVIEVVDRVKQLLPQLKPRCHPP